MSTALKLQPAADPMLIDMAELSPRISQSISTIKRLVATDSIPYVRIGRSVRFSPPAIEKWIAAGCPRSRGGRS